MKSKKVLIATIIMLSFSVLLNAQRWQSVRGDKDVVKSERETDSFTGIKVSSGIDVILRQGNDISVEVEADKNLHQYIITEVRNGILNVYVDDVSIREAERKQVNVTMREISSIRTTSAGDVKGETPITAGDLELSASSAGNISLEIDADEVNVNISSSGDVTLKGKAVILEADLSSAGDLNASGLAVRQANVSVSSAGDADINVSERLTARASSAGDISYSGDPKFVDAHSSSAGGIHRR